MKIVFLITQLVSFHVKMVSLGAKLEFYDTDCELGCFFASAFNDWNWVFFWRGPIVWLLCLFNTCSMLFMCKHDGFVLVLKKIWIFCCIWNWRMTMEEPFRPREKLLEKQRYFQSIHKHTYLKGPLDKITSVAIPLALAGSTLYLIVSCLACSFTYQLLLMIFYALRWILNMLFFFTSGARNL